ncbi:pirin family protein [Alistipes sp.]|uniref:pirin family protein n=1 Tax=Alistipes sp. TaxID=1872444 RepID=UPI000E9EB6E6|nr:pirin family protein [Alistipes sp.]HBX89847.1 hypothetical protein [Alistipes sp.]HCN13489.1 hypothetical protein [Alistipes sp.]
MESTTAIDATVHRAAVRGHADLGWLDSYRTFSFGRFYDPERMGFGALCVLNDDSIAPGEGYGASPHADVEIVTLPLEGLLRHGDDRGYAAMLAPGDVQVVSTGSGMLHREYNGSAARPVRYLQLWFRSAGAGFPSRYEQVTLPAPRRNALRPIVAPEEYAHRYVARIRQRVWIYTLDLDPGRRVEYRLKSPGHGLYLFVIAGAVGVEATELGARDGMAVRGAGSLSVEGREPSRVLLVEVPVG